MKNILVLVFSFFLSVLSTSCNRDGELKVSVSESDEEYKFYAHYQESDTREIQRYINRSLAPNIVFSDNDDDQVVHTKLVDGTSLRVKSSPGELEIKVDKKHNSPASVQRIRNMCLGVKGIVDGKQETLK